VCVCVCVCVRYSWWIGKAGYRKRAQGLSKECAQRCMYAEFGGNVLGLGGPPLLWTKAHYICKEKSLRQLNVEADTSCCRLSRMQGFVCMCAVTHLCVRNNKCVCVQIRQRKTNRCSCLLSTPGLSWPLSLAVLTGRTCTKL